MQYEVTDNMMIRVDDKGNREVMCNFWAWIEEEIRYVDGDNVDTWLIMAGIRQTKDDEGKVVEIPLKETKVKAGDFPVMNWVTSSWGMKCVIFPGGGIRDDIRTAIQLASNPTVTTVYKSMGWQDVNGKPTYLHAGGGIGAKGNDPDIQIQLPQELSRYALVESDDVASCVKATLDLIGLAPPDVSWTLLAATLAPLFGQVDFGTHVTGRTGTFKSELMSLYQSHYGAGMDARHLPGSWSSTPNALEAQAYYAKNAPFVVDDFVPTGTAWQQRSYQTTADKIIRGQGNQAGRARLTDVSSLQTAMYPRGIVMSTGEDTPEGHSVRARMMIMELAPGDVKAKELTKAQKNRPLYSGTTAALVKHLAKNGIPDLTATKEEVRDYNADVGHSRTPSMLGSLTAAVWAFLDWCGEKGYIDDPEGMKQTAYAAIKTAAEKQGSFLESADPVDMFGAIIRQIFASGLGHVRTLNGGIPRSPTMLGWTKEGDPDAEVPMYKSHGPCIGWVKWDNGELYLELTAGMTLVKKVGGSEMTLSKQTLMKRLKDAGTLTRVDDARQRNTVRITAENHPRQVLSLSIPSILDTQEATPDSEE